MQPSVAPPRITFIDDLFNGAVLGDYAERLGLTGHVTMAVLGFVPVIGTFCAIRDFFADRRKKDGLGMFLNLLALIPFLGGFPKTALVLHTIRHAGRAVQATGSIMHNHRDPSAPGV